MKLEDHGFSNQEQFAAQFKPLAELLGETRKQLIAQGFSRTGAERFASDYFLYHSITPNKPYN